MRAYQVFAGALVLTTGISVSENPTTFSLTGPNVSYIFHVDNTTNDLRSNYYGSPVADTPPGEYYLGGGWSNGYTNSRREFPDSGRGDFRLPAVHIAHPDGDTVSSFQYQYYNISSGKPSLAGLPATFGEDGDVETLTVHLWDNFTSVAADLHYSIFPNFNAIVRSFQVTNWGEGNVTIERAASFSVDLPAEEYEMIELHGDWGDEANLIRRNIDFGTTSAGYSSHYYNPFFALVSPSTTETQGPCWGFSLVYTGSFSAEVERWSHGIVRVLLGLNPLQLSWPLGYGETFTSPEVVSVYSADGIGEMSRQYHSLYRQHLSRSKYTLKTRPPLLNSWEGFGFNYNASSLVGLARESAGLGIQLFAMDDGWFGVQYPRNNASDGLGDWIPNPQKFPDGLAPFVNQVENITVANSSDTMKFGLWVEPEMVDLNSTLYHEHPDWAMHSGNKYRTLQRNQLVLNLALPEVQDHIIGAIGNVLSSANIEYVKWDNNRGIDEMPAPWYDHAYMLGMYRVIDNLTTSYPDILFEGCASGGGRFNPGLLYYWPQHWTSDNTDGYSRVFIQFGTSLVYPPSSMSCHVSDVPNGQTGRVTPFSFRANVAMMCGSFGFELDPKKLDAADYNAIPGIIAQQAKINPIVLDGDFYRLADPTESDYPAAQFVLPDGSQSIVFAYLLRYNIKPMPPPLKLQGLEPDAKYNVGNETVYTTWSGSTLMNAGLNIKWSGNAGDYQSEVIWVTKQ